MKIPLIAALMFFLAAQGYAGLCISHRGYAAERHENTLESIEAAWETGADVVELDVRLLADRSLVLFHDSKVDGVHIKTLTYPELQARVPGHPITMLHDALAAGVPGRTILLDLKDTTRPTLKQVVELIQDRQLTRSKIILQAMDLEALMYLRTELPRTTPLFYVTHLKRRGTLRKAPDAAKLASALADAGVDGISAKGRRFVTQAYVNTFKQMGMQYFVWTINDVDRMKHYASLGADGIITDDPMAYRTARIERPHGDVRQDTTQD